MKVVEFPSLGCLAAWVERSLARKGLGEALVGQMGSARSARGPGVVVDDVQTAAVMWFSPT